MDNHSKLTNEDFQAVGQYVFHFESLVGDIRTFIYFMLDFRGLDSISIANIILGNKMFTAKPLLDLCESIFGDQTGQMIDKKYEKDVKGLVTRFNKFKKGYIKAFEKRNEILHSTYFIDPDKGNLISIKARPNKGGWAGRVKHNIKEEIDEEVIKMKHFKIEIRDVMKEYSKLLKLNGLMNQPTRTYPDMAIFKNKKTN